MDNELNLEKQFIFWTKQVNTATKDSKRDWLAESHVKEYEGKLYQAGYDANQIAKLRTVSIFM